MATTALDPEDPKSDMTPMIDVVFLMVIFFVCIDFKTLEAKVDAFLPFDKGGAPTFVRPVEQLQVAVHVVEPGTEVLVGERDRFVLSGHRVRWQVGPVACADAEACARELRRVAGDPARFVPDPTTGSRRPMDVVVDGLAGARYDDVARTADMCRAAGFETVQLGGGLGPR